MGTLLDLIAAPPAKSLSSPRFGLLGEIALKKGIVRVSGDPNSVFTGRTNVPVGNSRDLERVLSIPRRTRSPSAELQAKWTAALRREVTACECVKKWGYCITELLPIQALALDEAHSTGSLVGLIGVGHGKTGVDILLPMVVPNTKNAALLVPPKLRNQFLSNDFPQWSVHFKTPNLAGGNDFIAGRPTLHLIAYSALSSAKNSDILTRMPYDLIIADEAHNLKDPKSARTKRFLRAEEPRFIPLSGTMTTRSPKDCAHLFSRALGDGSPLPLSYSITEEWAGAIEATSFPRPMGALSALCSNGETVRDGFRRRIVETPGVIATSEASIGTSLVLTGLHVDVPAEVRRLIRNASEGERPDGEQAMDMLTAAAWARQLSAGFYHRWIYPRGEPEKLVAAWFEARKAYFKEMRTTLKRSSDFMDSPFLLHRAAMRWHQGYTHEGKVYPAECSNGPSPVWDSEHWGKWAAIKDKVQPETEVVWCEPFLLDACEEWAQKNTGIIWTEHAEFGAVLAGRLKTEWYNGGQKNPELEKGDHSIVASIKANSDGLNLQRAFSSNLMASTPSSGKVWEQMLGRTHRQGQLADEVTADIFLHTDPLRRALSQAVLDARYQQGITGSPQKLCYASFTNISLTDLVSDGI